MPSIVPRNPAPIPGMAGATVPGGFAVNQTGTQGNPYWLTDWTRLGANPASLVNWTGNENDSRGATYGRAAMPPGYGQASYFSRYGPQWRGAAFGPSGRIAAPSEPVWPSMPGLPISPPVTPQLPPVIVNPSEKGGDVYKPVDPWNPKPPIAETDPASTGPGKKVWWGG